MKSPTIRIQYACTVTGTSALVKLFKSHLKELLSPLHPHLPQTASKRQESLGFENCKLSFLQFNIRNQKANYLHNLKYSMIHVYLTLGISLGGSWYSEHHRAFHPEEWNTDYLQNEKLGAPHLKARTFFLGQKNENFSHQKKKKKMHFQFLTMK